MRVLGLDLGEKRIGVAISDPTGDFAFPVGAIESRGAKRDVAAVKQLVEEREVGRVVVGLPLHMDGRAGDQALAAKRFAEALATAAHIPVDTLDERWTSREAERALGEISGRGKRGARQRRRSGAVDAAAATLILRTYLAQQIAKAEQESEA